MNQICTNQNKQENIELLAAQRVLHSKAKFIFQIRGLVALAFLVLGVFQFDNSLVKSFLALLSILYLVADLLLEKIEENIRNKASSVQEVFDTRVLNLDWNYALIPEKPDYETINRSVDLYKKKFNSYKALENWYSVDVCRVEIMIARAICQRSNVVWSSNLQKSLAVKLIVITTMLIVASVIWALSLDMSISDSLISIFLPMAPAINLLVKNIISFYSTAKELGSLRKFADDLINVSITGDSVLINTKSRMLQNEIYRYRSTSRPVPDWYYFLLKNKYEADMNYNVVNKLQELGLH